jgi:septum formation inhibitor MinC
VLARAASSSDHHSKYVTYIHRSVSSNERVESGGCIVIHGSVEEGARITSAGDVMVWGRQVYMYAPRWIGRHQQVQDKVL